MRKMPLSRGRDLPGVWLLRPDPRFREKSCLSEEKMVNLRNFLQQSEFPDLTVFRFGIPHQLVFPVIEDAAEYPHYAAVA